MDYAETVNEPVDEVSVILDDGSDIKVYNLKDRTTSHHNDVNGPKFQHLNKKNLAVLAHIVANAEVKP